MSRYPDESTRRFDQQFAEPAERNERRREAARERQIETLHTLIAHLSVTLTDNAPALTEAEAAMLRRRVANALPPTRCPEWLAEYRDPPVVRS